MFMCQAGNGESLEFHLHLGRLCRLSFDVQMPGSDVDISREDWIWLQRQCRVRSDWQLGWCVSSNPREQATACQVRVGFSGRVVCPRRSAKLEFRLEEQSPYSRLDGSFGRRAWAYRARVPPWCQRPEWEFDDHDVCMRAPMDAKFVFRHTPSPNMVKAIGRFRLIRRSPLFHGMELGQTCTDNDEMGSSKP